jgi:IS1 family transposase
VLNTTRSGASPPGSKIWSFVYAKDKNVPEANKGSAGSVWTWTAIDADTKLIPSFYVGGRDAYAANVFIRDLSERLAHRVQLTSDGHKPYLDAVERAFGSEIDYAMLVKHYGPAPEQSAARRRYSPAECVGTTVGTVTGGQPDKKHISTSFAERANLSMRMGIRRFTRLTNAFSKKVENHFFALAITSCITTMCASIRPFGLPRRWPLACRRPSGRWTML